MAFDKQGFNNVHEALSKIETFLTANGWTIEYKNTIDADHKWMFISKNSKRYILRSYSGRRMTNVRFNLSSTSRGWRVRDEPVMLVHACDAFTFDVSDPANPVNIQWFEQTKVTNEVCLTGYFPKAAPMEAFMFSRGDSIHVAFKLSTVNYCHLHFGDMFKAVPFEGGRCLMASFINNSFVQAGGGYPYSAYPDGSTMFGTNGEVSDSLFEIGKSAYYDETNNTGWKWCYGTTLGSGRGAGQAFDQIRSGIQRDRATAVGGEIRIYGRPPWRNDNRNYYEYRWTMSSASDRFLMRPYQYCVQFTQYWADAAYNRQYSTNSYRDQLLISRYMREDFVGTEGRKLLMPMYVWRSGRRVSKQSLVPSDLNVKDMYNNKDGWQNIVDKDNIYMAGYPEMVRVVNPMDLIAEKTLEFGSEKWMVFPDMSITDSSRYTDQSAGYNSQTGWTQPSKRYRPWIAVRYD